MSEILACLRKLNPGESYVYHIGYIAKDRLRKNSDPDEVARAKLIDQIARTAYDLYLQGLVLLTQRRCVGLDPDPEKVSYEYIATGTHPPFRVVTEMFAYA